MKDQAEALRRLVGGWSGRERVEPGSGSPVGLRLARVVAVTSGKGGVGKTSLAVNLALAARELGQRVAVVDADLGLANVDIMLGLLPRFHLGDVANGRCSVEEALCAAPGGIQVLPGASGLWELADAGAATLRRLVAQLRHLDLLVDLLLIDTGAGIGRQVISFLASAPEVVVVLTPEPTALTDAYSLLKVLTASGAAPRVYAVVNMCRRRGDGERVGGRLADVSARFLGLPVLLLGHIPFDEAASRAVVNQVPLILQDPQSPAAAAIRQVARRLLGVGPAGAGNGLASAFQRLVRTLRGRSERGAQPPVVGAALPEASQIGSPKQGA